MKKITVKFTLGIGYANATHEDEQELEFDDNMTQEEIEAEIEEDWQEWTNNYIDGGWTICK
jgi:hypothetical protein